MSARTIGFWAATGLFAVVYLGSGIADLLHASRVIQTLGHLGYAPYVSNILGPWKVAAAIALLAPGMPRVKEWAYAGTVFELTGGFQSHLYSGDPASAFMVPLVLLGLSVTSYLLRPESRRLQLATGAAERPVAQIARAA